MRRLWTAVLVVSLTLPSTFVLADDQIPVPDQIQPESNAPVMSFSDSLFRTSVRNIKSPKTKIDDSDFFCRDSKEISSSFDPRVLFPRYISFYKKSSAKANSSNMNKTASDNNNEICAIYYRERYARSLFEISVENLNKGNSAKQMQDQYMEELKILQKINQGVYTENGRPSYRSREDLAAVKDLIMVLQEYWLTRFITFAYLEKTKDFAIYGVGGVALSLGTVAGLLYFLAPKWAPLAAKIPRYIMNLGMIARTTILTGTAGVSLGSAFAAASDSPGQYASEVWPSPVEALNLNKDKVTTDTENVERNMLFKEAAAVVGSVSTGYVGWHLMELGAEKVAQKEFVRLLFQGIKTSKILTKEVFVTAISSLRLTSTAEKVYVVSRAIHDSEFVSFLSKGYKSLHGTATIGSVIITDIMLHYLIEWIRERTTKELNDSYLATVQEFNEAIIEFKKSPKDSNLSRKVFTSAQKMFESLRMLVSHLLIPAYASVSEFSESYRNKQKVPMICSIAKINVGSTDETMVKLFLRDLQKNERESYLSAVDALDLFDKTINDTQLYFFTNFFKRKSSLLKISFFFDEKFGLDANKLSKEQNLEEFGKGYVRVLQGELAVNLKPIGRRLLSGIEEAKSQLEKGSGSEEILQYLAQKDYLNASLYHQCLEIEKEFPTQSTTNLNSRESISVKRWRFGL